MELYGNQEEQVAFAGMLYGMNPKTVVTYPAKQDIKFGKGVIVNPDGTVKEFDGTSEFGGISVFHQCEGGKYKAKDAVAVMKNGFIWVEAEDGENEKAIKPGKVAYIGNGGEFTSDSSGRKEVGTFESFCKDGLALVHLK